METLTSEVRIYGQDSGITELSEDQRPEWEKSENDFSSRSKWAARILEE